MRGIGGGSERGGSDMGIGVGNEGGFGRKWLGASLSLFHP